MDEPIELPITGELDLHTFRPNEIGDLLPDYFEECRKRGILSVRAGAWEGHRHAAHRCSRTACDDGCCG